MEADARGIGLNALVLDDAAVMDKQESIGVKLAGRPFPLGLQAVSGSIVGYLQLSNLSWTCQQPPSTHSIKT